jgi:hypothetical protein
MDAWRSYRAGYQVEHARRYLELLATGDEAEIVRICWRHRHARRNNFAASNLPPTPAATLLTDSV